MNSDHRTWKHRARPRPSTALWTCLAGIITVAAIGQSCSQEFQGTGVGGSAPKPQDSVSPKETESSPQNSPLPPEVCTKQHKAARLYFIVDNSNSHGYVVPGEELRRGTDPARLAVSVRGRSEWRTYRQEALYTIIRRAAELDRMASEAHSEFLGSEVGIAYFPKYSGSGNPEVDPGTLEDLARFVDVSGPGGTGASVFPQRMTPLKALSGGDLSEPSSAASDALWNAFNFTQAPGGSTPYATGLRAAVTNFLPGVADTDPREQLVLFLTDGLPTDETPSAIRSLRAELGDKVKLVIISMYDPNEDPRLADSPLYKNLQSAFLGPQQWATKPSNPDKYPRTTEGFQRYWSDLISVPEAISNQIVRVAKAADLTSTIESVITASTTCTSTADKKP